MSVAVTFPASAQAVLFDFDNVALYTPLPVNVTVNGITAHLSATGQGYSIQDASVLGFTPQGLSGHILYPNSIYLTDLLISFDSTLYDFSIMYASHELACDDAATMRVTAYLNGSYIGTNTKTATYPGTWPVDILRCSFPRPFNSVVIHYDKKPPTCQDYGPNFLADNMRVTTYNPSAIPLCPGNGNGTINANLTGINYQWQSGNDTAFTNITDNANYTGTNTPSLQLNNIPTGWNGTKYRCVADSNYSDLFILQFTDTWTGQSDTSWENPANWNCHATPDANTDVLVNTGSPKYPTVSSNANCRSLNLAPGAAVNIKSGFSLQITGKK